MGTSRGIQLLNWDTVTQDKAQGGLGIRSMRKMNIAMLAKLGWRFCFDQDSLWVQVMAGKYAKGSPSLHRLVHKHSSSNCWRGIVAASMLLRLRLCSKVYNGKKTLFWRDVWLGDTPLLDQGVRPLLPMESWEMVSAYWEQGREWRWEELSCLLPMQTLNTLRCKVLHENEYSDDGYCWGPTLDGSFSVKTAYSLVQPSLHGPSL